MAPSPFLSIVATSWKVAFRCSSNSGAHVGDSTIAGMTLKDDCVFTDIVCDCCIPTLQRPTSPGSQGRQYHKADLQTASLGNGCDAAAREAQGLSGLLVYADGRSRPPTVVAIS